MSASEEGEKDAVQGDPAVVGLSGVLTIGTRGQDGAGEVLVKVRGGSETYLAWSAEPLPKDQTVLVVEAHPGRIVDVVAWSDPFSNDIF